MDSKYDRKFEEMKQYIPFLENMINRLESGPASANPRQAQLDKIRSLRDLLIDKKKRMKMENLLKCEQVLVNLYAKVEQRDTLPGVGKSSDPLFPSHNTEAKADLNSVRHKLKKVASITKIEEQDPDTLPEIARASETEEVCTPGSKEPALFQRRPNKSSKSPSSATRSDTKSPLGSASKRNYTRVLVSPDKTSQRWNTPEKPTPEKPLFSRRSPRRSPPRNSTALYPPHYKKDRKKSSNQTAKHQPKDFNITLNVPEESLNSLNTEDIVNRIMDCSDNDVDISTLRDLRSQIIGELKKTGGSGGLSNLIMKSYKKKKKKNRKNPQKTEVEEGELSDSESEAIESVYGSLVLVDKIKNSPSEVKAVTTRKEEQPRKIQICFVINSDKEGTSEVGIKDSPAVIDVPELEMFETEKAKTAETKTTKTVEPKDTSKENQVLLKGDKVEISSQVTDKLPNTGKPNNQSQIQSQDVITIDDEDDAAINKTIPIATNEKESAINNDTSNNKSGNSEFETVSNNKSDVIPREATEPVAFKANFYKPINDHEIEETNVLSSEVNKVEKLHIDTNNPPTETNANEHEEKRCVESDKQVEAADVSTNNLKAKENVVHDTRENVEIPLLNLEPVVPAPLPKQVVSEIDILQALKNEILNEPIAIPGTETATPALHQPKITKVASAQEILKKRISIEKYKEKSVTPSKTPSVVVKKSRSYLSKEDYFKRQSLKLTEKECERFNFPAKLAIDDSSDDEELSLDDVYGDLAPRSPENEDLGETSATPPIIIPADSVKTSVISSKLDVDMRQMMPMSSPNSSKHASSLYANAVPVTTNNNDALPETIRTESKPEQNYIPPLLSLDVYPRLKWDVNMPINKESPNPHKNPERTPISALNYPNMTPNRTPSMTPSRTPSMTPNARTFEMTPSRQSLEVEDNTNRKHVYAPLLPLPMYDSRENREISVNRDTHRPHWELNGEIKSDGRRSTDGNNSRKWEDRDPRSASIQRENSSDYQKSRYNESDRYSYDKRDDYSYSRLDCPRTPVHSFGRSDCPNTPTPSFGRMDTPMTPNHPFGRSECPATPSHPFGRSECPSTPSHPFGRSECPSTPSHPFGRSECPTTPSHSFGRSECPPTPTHSFGRSECPLTPSHQFGRSECPSTPSHPFGRSEGPMTPSHPFGNSDKAPMTPSHQFGRSDYSQNSLNTGAKFGKDPRLNRATDYESTSRNYDKDRYYKDVPKRSYTNPDPYRNYSREQSIGRNDRSFEKSGRPYGRDQVSHSDGRTPREPEQLYTRERVNHNNDYQQEFRSSRAPSHGRNYQEGAEKTLSVKPQSGRSFTIDTSVNRTFQEFLNEKGIQIFDYSPANTFDARRQRATSVGRSLVRTPSVGRTNRESSVGRTLSKPQPTRNDSDLRNRNNFVRARSMGREVADNKQEKSFKDIKADFKTYSANYKKQDIKVAATDPRKMNYRDPRTRKLLKEMQEKKKSYQSDTKPVYSPRKNNRDPRLRREEHSDGNRYRAEEKSRERKSYGIVYSNDNIARGTILGSGYGVRNYKIPKIKRAIEEKQHIEKVEQNEKDNKSKVKGTKLVKSSDTDKTKNNSIERNTADPSGVSKKGKKHSKDEKSKTSEKYDTKKSTPMHGAKKTTRQLSPDLSKSKLCEDKVTRKSKRAVISDSDSDSHKEEKIVDKSTNKNEAAVPLLTKSRQTDKEEDDLLDNSFGIDDLEIFPENMVSDPVMDNINALIAHLDNDISDSKIDNSGQFTKEISLENMLENITSPEGDSTVDESLNDLNELINEDLNQVKTQSYEKSPMLTSEQTEVDNFAMVRELKKPSENGDFKSDESGQILVGKDAINQGEPIHTNEKVQAVLNDSPKLPMSNKISSIEEQHHIADKQKASEPVLSTEDRSTNFEGISLSSNVSHSLNEMKSESLVSTTDKTEKHLLDKVENKSAEKQTIENRADRLSTPDSTINIDETKESKLCDSTNELHSDIASTHGPAEISKIKSIEKTDKEVDPQIQSIGSLLSILQDKTKIKELLGMLSGNSVENEKIKKNLEKLSEIVSDDENDNDTSVGEKVIPTEPNVESDDKNKLGDKPIDKIETEEKVEKKVVRSESADKLEKNDKTDLNKVGAESFDELQVKEKSDLNEIIAESSDKQDANGTIAVNEIRIESSHKLEVMEKANINEIEAELSNKRDANDQIEKKDARKESAENLEANNKTDLSIVGVKTSDKLEVYNKTDENDARTGLTDKLEVKKKAGVGEGSVKSSDKTEVTDSNEPYPDGLDEDTSSELSTKPKKSKKRSGKRRNRKWRKNALSGKEKRVTRSEAAGLQTNKPKKASRELKLLHDDIKEMFISDDILNATGIRMCRLAKLVDDKTCNQDEETITSTGSKPVVVLEKFKDKNDMLDGKPLPEKPIRKKTGPKPKTKPSTSTSDDLENLVDTPKLTKNKPGPKSKTKPLNQVTTDPYAFESDSVSEKKVGDALVTSSDSESDSLASSVSLGSSEALTELKKKIKRKRGSAWQSGVIKPKKKKKVESKATSLTDSSPNKNATTSPNSPSTVTVPDLNSFTDKSYCFVKNVYSYPCRLCHYTGNSIVHHYKKHHPHSEIPLSRMEPSLAREAIVQCEEINFQTISKVTTDKYVCRFCLKEFSKRKINILETFFWHVVSTHTGEYKQLCSECINVTRCPFNLDIPPPPKDVKGQLMGYICGKCNFTQISLENLKTHVIVRHNDEQTEVYTINLAIMSKKAINALMKQSAQIEKPRVLRSSRSNQSMTDMSDDRSENTEGTDRLSEFDSAKPSIASQSLPDDVPKGQLQSRLALTFENDDNTNIPNTVNDASSDIKKETDNEAETHTDQPIPEPDIPETTNNDNTEAPELEVVASVSSDHILTCPHFKINYTDAGTKEYECCINGTENHYKTNLLISMKKHIQTKHSEKWDGYCFFCKVIVTPGQHSFKDCLQHILDKHLDNFPIERAVVSEPVEKTPEVTPIEKPRSPKNYINVRPLSELLFKENETAPEESDESLPKIQSVVSLGDRTAEAPIPSSTPPAPEIPIIQENVALPNLPIRKQASTTQEPRKYEEAQAEVMTKKHQVVLNTMISDEKLVKIFKCAGRFCYFTSDNIEDALLHASTHQRIGGENAMHCAYCDFEFPGNAIALVMHVFKEHGRCQYSCSRCFYRAAAGQLVRAHMIRVHGELCEADVILKTLTVTPGAEDSVELLPRETAVQYYVCADDPNCKFRTYPQGKFSDHLLKHTPPHSCHICSTVAPTPNDLIAHMKSHDMKVYQCTWCVHGADNEPELLAHASSRHPNRQPQAYLRVITSKDGTTKKMVLPLAQFNKSVVKTRVVSPTASENPVREAERSIELETLIGSMITISDPQPIDTQPEDIPEGHDQELIVPDEMTPVESLLSIPRLVTPPPSTSAENNLPVQLLPVLKIEPNEETPTKKPSDSIVICLDSDEEDSTNSAKVIDLSDDESHPIVKETVPVDLTTQKIPLTDLFKCPKCKNKYKTLPAFKRHYQACCPNIKDGINCPHCPKTFTVRSDLYNHYEKDHRHTRDIPPREAKSKDPNAYQSLNSDQSAVCAICNLTHRSVTFIKCHLKTEHGITNFDVTSKYADDGKYVYTVRESEKAKQIPKRKLSAGNSESPTKRRRFGPHDIDQLPTKPILDDHVFCSLCEFSSKVRLNIVRHLQGHADKQPVAHTVPVNPVPHLESNEKHFDKMVNLASSSIVNRTPDKPPKESVPTVSLVLSPEEADRYPKFVPERQRYTCGYIGCSYTSVDETMLKCHWETLHEGSSNFLCTHCPPNQQLNTAQALTSTRIISHLKMHDVCLYACSSCSTYYHHRRYVAEKHITEVHKGVGQVMVVREEANPLGTGPSQPAPTAAPSMDLKPWQCGLCKFKSMLRQEVVEHCSKIHCSKMQFKCPNCPFRTSTLDNVRKHQSNSHPKSTDVVIHYYYQEGSIHDEGGTPRWMVQRQKMGHLEPEVKAEVDAPTPSASQPPILIQIQAAGGVDLNIVKKEVEDQPEETLEDLCKRFGQFCEPNGLKFKCPLCKIVMEDTKDAMQSHLFEELKYRKWSCSICTYKAFHKTGLYEHMAMEHRQNRDPIELPKDVKVERWVMELLAHQTKLIAKTKENFAKQKIPLEKPRLFATASVPKPVETSVSEPPKTEELITNFGEYGASYESQFACPKCDFKIKEESAMKDHLETELNRIRWRCSNCSAKFQEYHEAQLHCKSIHPGRSARPVEALRDATKRAAWVEAVIRSQKLGMPLEAVTQSAYTNPVENSLLVVRYEQRVPTPEEDMLMRRKRPAPTPPNIPATPATTPDSDDERLVIDEPTHNPQDAKKILNGKKCSYCDFTSKYSATVRDHEYRHFNLKPNTCTHCGYGCFTPRIGMHNETMHPHLPSGFVRTKLPDGPPLTLTLASKGRRPLASSVEEVTCLVCEITLRKSFMSKHTHDKLSAVFGKKGELVVKCCNCLALLPNVTAVEEHHHASHSNAKLNYAFHRLGYDTREIHCCGYCAKRFKFIRDLRSHHNAVHSSLQFKYAMKPFSPACYDVVDVDEGMSGKRTLEDPVAPTPKRVAKKSTTKLPKLSVARKSTTKLPLYFYAESESESDEEYSYYSSKPTPLKEYENVTARMPFCNTVMSFTLKKLSEIIKLSPQVVVKDINK